MLLSFTNNFQLVLTIEISQLSQGDLVFGVRGAGTSAKIYYGCDTQNKKNCCIIRKVWNIIRFYGSLNKNSLDGEHNEQIGPATPGVTPLDPKLYNKSNSDNPSGNIEQLGYDVNQDGEIDDVEAKLTPPRVAGDKNWDEGEPINSAQLEFILSNQVKVEIKEDDLEKPLVVNGQIVGYEQKPTGRFELVNLMENEESTAYITKIDQAVTQNNGGIDKDITNNVLTELK